jgi:hypothetical protein
VRNQRNKFVALIAAAGQASVEMGDRLKLLASEQEILAANLAAKAKLLTKVRRGECLCHCQLRMKGTGTLLLVASTWYSTVITTAVGTITCSAKALRLLASSVVCVLSCMCGLQARTACAASVKERDALYTELHSLGATFRAKHDKLQEQVGWLQGGRLALQRDW